MSKKKRALTIKKRLFISNILMIAIPVMLTILIGGIFIMAYMGMSGAGNWESLTARNNFNQTVSKSNTLTEKWTETTEPKDIRKDINAFHKNNKSCSLYVYMNGQPLFTDLFTTDSNLLALSLSQQDDTISISGSGAYLLQTNRAVQTDIN